MSKRLALLFGILAVFVVPIQSQTERTASLSIGAVKVSLGMSKEAVLAKLAEHYRYDPATGFVWSTDGPPFTLHGTLGFDDKGRLARAHRSWEPDDQQSGFPTTEALYNALTQITTPTETGSRMCRCGIFLKEKLQPEGGTRTIFITDGTRTIEVAAIRLNAANPSIPKTVATITESIER